MVGQMPAGVIPRRRPKGNLQNHVLPTLRLSHAATLKIEDFIDGDGLTLIRYTGNP